MNTLANDWYLSGELHIAKLEVNLANNSGWNGNLKELRLLAPDNDYYLDVNAYFVTGGNVGYQFSPNGQEGLVITTPGNVGIGTVNPQAPLKIKGGSGGTFQIGRNNLAFEGGNEGGNLHIESREGMYLNHYSNKPIFLGQGKVGIRMTTPSAKLEVNGTFAVIKHISTDSEAREILNLLPSNSVIFGIEPMIPGVGTPHGNLMFY